MNTKLEYERNKMKIYLKDERFPNTHFYAPSFDMENIKRHLVQHHTFFPDSTGYLTVIDYNNLILAIMRNGRVTVNKNTIYRSRFTYFKHMFNTWLLSFK